MEKPKRTFWSTQYLISLNLRRCRRPRFNFWVGNFPWRRDSLSMPLLLGSPGGSDGKESACSVGDLGSILGLGRCPGGGHGNLFQYSCLENLREEPGGLQSTGSQRVRHDSVTKHTELQTFCM